MKKILLLVLLVSFATTVNANPDAEITGTVQLKAKKSSSDDFLELLKCGLEELPKKLLRKIKVSADYSGGSTVTVSEGKEEGSEQYAITFRVPSILRAVTGSKKAKKEKIKFGTVGVDCTQELPDDNDNTNSLDDNFSNSIAKVIKPHKLRAKKLSRTKKQRKKNKIAKFLTNGSAGAIFSIKKAVAVRKGNKGKLKGTFVSKEDKALGRFAIKFNYNEAE